MTTWRKILFYLFIITDEYLFLVTEKIRALRKPATTESVLRRLQRRWLPFARVIANTRGM